MKFNTVWDRWQYNAKNTPEKEAIVHWLAGEEPVRWKFEDLLKTANSFSLQLKKNGIEAGQVCAIIIRHNINFYPLYMGIVGAGAIPAVLAYPNPRLHPDKFRDGIKGMSQRSGLDWIFTEESLEPIIRPLLDQHTSIKGLHFPLQWDLSFSDTGLQEELDTIRSNKKPEDPFLLQHSSGTTGLQKPVLLSNKAILQHVDNYGESINFSPEDKVISWLPLYHDMGLIAAYHVPLAYGITSVQIDPFEWVLAPVLLLEAMSKEKGTLSWLPNFAYNMLADKVPDDELEGFRLDTWRLAINCSEPVRHESHMRFLKRFSNYGFRQSALSACYAMAETTYGVTQTTPGELPAVILADRQKLAEGTVEIVDDEAKARACVSSGKVIKGCKVKIVDEKRVEVPTGKVGEVAIWSVSMFDGYRNYPEKTAEVLEDGWFYSGDFGFIHNDECFVIGRKKDIIIVAGKNIYPEDIEDTVSKVTGVIPGRVVAFGSDDKELGTEVVSVIAETNAAEDTEKRKLKMAILEAGINNDQNISKIYLVPSRWLIKSSAGKPSRKANKERVLQNNDFLME
ncbi:MAG: AMP-binding protein [Ignavibacteriales bacterium]|nr:AMP-binding protein [Ignavibacteriales bacterium]